MTYQEKLLAKAQRTHRWHSHGYAHTWGPKPENQAFYRAAGKPYTGNLAEDYNCTVEDLARAFADTHCPLCHRSYASMAEGRQGAAADPLWHMHWHIWFPDWIVVCAPLAIVASKASPSANGGRTRSTIMRQDDMTDTTDFYTHDGLDFPDSTHDPNPLRHYSPEFRQWEEAETARQKALIAAWEGVPWDLRQRAIAKCFGRFTGSSKSLP
jgi:hypothetical protein